MKKIFSIVLLLVFAVGGVLTSCDSDKEFLEENPKAQISVDNAFQTPAQILSTIVASYSAIQSLNFETFSGMQTDELGVFSVFGGQAYTIGSWSATGDWTAGTAWIESNNAKNSWDVYYQAIAYANQALGACDLESMSWTSESQKTQLMAEARVLRGFCYLRLAECFGGVPLVDTYSEEVRFDYERATRQETYEFAVEDLKYALENLPDKPNIGRAGKGAAAIMLSEACLGLGVETGESSYYDDAITYADQCIALHPLMTARFGVRADPTDNGSNLGVPNYLPDSLGGCVYCDLFYKQNPRDASNTEGVWVMLGAKDYDEWSANEDVLRAMRHSSYSPALRDARLADSDLIPWPEGGASDFYSKSSDGSKVTTIPAIASNGVPFGGAPTWFATFQVWDEEHNKGDDDRGREGVAIRRYYPVTNPNHPDYGVEQLWGTDPDMKGWEDLDKTNWATAMEYFAIHDKICPVDSWGYDENTYYSSSVFGARIFRDSYLYRSAEAYLLKAEAQYRLGDASSAATTINVLRTRAHAASFDASEINLQVILDERCRELMYEENRWATFLRQEPEVWKPRIYSYGMYTYNRTYATLNPNAELYPTTQQFDFYTGTIDWNLWPIPKNYVDLNTDNPDGMKQNDGWGSK